MLPSLTRRSAKLVRRWGSLTGRSATLVRWRPSLTGRSAKLVRRWGSLTGRSATLVRRWPSLIRGRPYETSSRVNEGERCASAEIAKASEGIGLPSLTRRSAKLVPCRPSLLRRTVKLAPRHRSERFREGGGVDAYPFGRRLRPSQADARPREGCTKEREPAVCPSKRAPSAREGNGLVSKMAEERSDASSRRKPDRHHERRGYFGISFGGGMSTTSHVGVWLLCGLPLNDSGPEYVDGWFQM